jgi:CRISPR-associated endonuclease/helicase Cas3
MTTPTPDRFVEYYKAVYGKQSDPKFGPFPWQERVAASVCAGKWPRAIALPTAAGKTACLDIAVFALACLAENAPRRIFFTVDRRIVVDQAWLHAKELAESLKDAKSGILKDVADSLRIIAQIDKDDAPLDVYALRGGMYRETAWARSPLQPTVIASTVDQVGSRLLFRGYGVSDSMKPIHAGLVGNDALILLDEAHCSKPFCQTMQAIEKYRQWNDSPAPFRFVSITATPSSDVPENEIERDREEDRSLTNELGKRIAATKPASLVVAEKAKGRKGINELVKVLEDWANKLATPNGCVGIIVNRVATARALKVQLGDEAVLLTGRMRPLDRDRLFDEKLRPLLSNAEGIPPRFVIGTQCLEVGADFDFHALVTECASLDALRQRFGRLNRVAKRNAAKAVVVIRGDQTEPKEAESDRDPIYGNSLPLTWKWLNNHNDGDTDQELPWVDFGVASIRQKWDATAEEDRPQLNAPSLNAPVLFPAFLDCWVQTHPIPVPDPDPAIFLHGPDNGTPDVQVVFRSDLGEDTSKWADIVALCPPSSSEAVPVRIGVFKRWLAGEEGWADTSGDVEGEPDETSEPDESTPHKSLSWEGLAKSKVVLDPKDIHPGGVYVVSTSLDANQLGDFPFGLTDFGDEAFQRSRDKALLRLRESKLDREADDFNEQLTDEIRSQAGDAAPKWLETAIKHLANPKNRIEERHPLGGWVVVGKRRLRQFAPEFLDDDESSYSPAGQAITLDDHSRGVADRARRFAAACGLEADTFALGGSYHDLGKLDPRFQRLLTGWAGRPPLAKSGSCRQRDPAVHQYPKGGRHELLSVAMLSTKTDDDLLLHLIATHHGSARPFADPVIENDAAKKPFTAILFDAEFQLESSAQRIAEWNAELPERFWRVVRKYGWWGAAYREAIFRLADHAQSRAEQEPKWEPPKDDDAQLPAFQWCANVQRLYSLPLPGLDGANPLGFLAAVGTLRLASEMFPGALLRWARTHIWHPVLELPKSLTADEFVESLYARIHQTGEIDAGKVADERHKEYRKRKKDTENVLKLIKDRRLRGKAREAAIEVEITPLRAKELAARREWLQALEVATPASFLSLGKSISVSVEEFASFALRMADRLHQIGPSGRADADFTPAFGCESCFDRHNKVIPTEFQLITGSGQQFFLDTFANLMEAVTVEKLRRVLIGPWTYSDVRLSFRWDPGEDRRYAFCWTDPGAEDGVPSEHAANLLAAFALPLFPVIPVARRAMTTGFDSSGEEATFTWPIWENPHRQDAAGSLFQLAQIHKTAPSSVELRSYGVNVAFRVRKFEVGKPPLSKLNLSSAVMI